MSVHISVLSKEMGKGLSIELHRDSVEGIVPFRTNEFDTQFINKYFDFIEINRETLEFYFDIPYSQKNLGLAKTIISEVLKEEYRESLQKELDLYVVSEKRCILGV